MHGHLVVQLKCLAVIADYNYYTVVYNPTPKSDLYPIFVVGGAAAP